MFWINKPKRKLVKNNLVIRLFTTLIATIFLATSTFDTTYAAMTWDDLFDITSNRAFYKPGDDCEGGSTPTQTIAGGGSLNSGDDLYILGDSITVGSAEKYRAAYSPKKINVFINASTGSSWKGAGGGQGHTPEGSDKTRKEALADDTEKAKNAEGIILAIGTNGGEGSNPIEEIIGAVRAINPNAPIYWVNTVQETVNTQNLGPFNKALDDKASTLRYTVVKWTKVFNATADPYTIPMVDANNYIPDDDGVHVHPNSTGQDALVGAVVAATTGGAASAVQGVQTDSSGQVLAATTETPATPAATTKPPIPDNPPVIDNTGVENAKITPDRLTAVSGVPNVTDLQGGIQIRKELVDPLTKLAAGFKAKFGRNLTVFSGYRNAASQQVSVDGAKAKGKPERAAPVGQSSHGWGLAVDIAKETQWSETGSGNFESEEYKWLASDGVGMGWKNPYYKGHGGQASEESWHWEYGTVNTWGAGTGGQTAAPKAAPAGDGGACCGGTTSSQAVLAATTDTPSNSEPFDIEYTDDTRGNRKVGVTIWSPGDSNTHPLVIFAPGQNQNSKSDQFYKRYLKAIAAQGFIVAGANYDNGNNNAANDVPGQADDIKFLITKVLSEEKVKGKINTAFGVGLVGHSDGGFASMIVGYANGKKDDRIKAVIAQSGANFGGFTYGSGPPLLGMGGSRDAGNTASVASAYGSIQTTYSALAKFKGADHDQWLVAENSTYKEAADAISGAFLKRMLSAEDSDATKLSKVAAKYTDKVDFAEKGTDTPGGAAGASSTSGSSCTCSVEGTSVFASTLPDTVPEPHRSLFTEAAKKFNVSPAYLTSLFLSEQANTWKPFDSPWASSQVGASGPFQFMPPTWRGHATDGDNDGRADIMNIHDAAYSAAHLIAAGTTVDTPMGDLAKPFKEPNTILYNAAAYNWGGGNIQNHTNAESPLTAAPQETQDYLNNVYTLITSGFTKSGKKTYPDPKLPGAAGSSTSTGGAAPAAGSGSCPPSGASGTFTPITGTHDELVARVLAETNIKWGNGLAGAGPEEVKQDVKDCLTDTALAGLAALAEQSGVKVIINTMARGHGGCVRSGTSDHGYGRGIDIGYFGNKAQGQPNHTEDGDKLYKFIYDNRAGLKINQAIWQYPQEGLQCVGGGEPVDCNTYYRDGAKPVISIHWHHIHIGFKP